MISRFNGSALLSGVKTTFCIRIRAGLLRPIIGNYSTGGTPDELQRGNVLKEYIRAFEQRTNHGRVLTADTSHLDTNVAKVRKHLTPAEKKDRKRWGDIRSPLETDYTLDRAYNLSRTLAKLRGKEILQIPVAPPLLDDSAMSMRSVPEEKPGRLYPDKIYEWDDFEKEVRSFTVPEGVGETRVEGDVLFFSLNLKGPLYNEAQEQSFLHFAVLEKLQEAGLLTHGTKGQAESITHAQPLGRADHFLIAGENKIVPIEFKSTQNLLLPEQAAQVVDLYNAAVEELERTGNRNKYWFNIRLPMTQLINYMINAESRYGVLTSATRSYFLKVVEGVDGVPRVFITGAWFTGQNDFMRAWVYVFHQAAGNGDFQYPEDLNQKWRKDGEHRDGADDSAGERSSKISKSDEQGRGGAGGPPTQRFMTWLDPGLAPSIPRVDGEHIKFMGLLGPGNHGVYLAQWEGNLVAVKAFDVYKDFKWFENEIRAYEYLKEAWGVLVPEPYFIADWFSLVLLGMQLGRSPNSNDVEFDNECDILFGALRRDYGFDHMDLHAGNVIYLPDKGGTGPARLVAIDLEAHEIMTVPTIRSGTY